MAQLSPLQLAFLREQKIALDLLFDASGMNRKTWQVAMKTKGKKFAYGTSITPCAQAGHTLRTRAGHCIQCKPENISFATRYSKPAHVYILGSAKKCLLKIGSTTDMSSRLANLNSEVYGGAFDWIELARTDVIKEAGRIEAGAQKALDWARVAGNSERPGRQHESHELFDCGFSEARLAISRLLPKEMRVRLKQAPSVLDKFEKKKAA